MCSYYNNISHIWFTRHTLVSIRELIFFLKNKLYVFVKSTIILFVSIQFTLSLNNFRYCVLIYFIKQVLLLLPDKPIKHISQTVNKILNIPWTQLLFVAEIRNNPYLIFTINEYSVAVYMFQKLTRYPENNSTIHYCKLIHFSIRFILSFVNIGDYLKFWVWSITSFKNLSVIMYVPSSLVKKVNYPHRKNIPLI